MNSFITQVNLIRLLKYGFILKLIISAGELKSKSPSLSFFDALSLSLQLFSILLLARVYCFYANY